MADSSSNSDSSTSGAVGEDTMENEVVFRWYSAMAF